MQAQAFRRFDWAKPSVKLITLHSVKGLEFSLVLVAGLQAMPFEGEALDEELRLLYVGMTRASHELVLSARGSFVVVERVKTSLLAVQRQFAAHGA
jgi:superfamily I DNA/RNA helicase